MESDPDVTEFFTHLEAIKSHFTRRLQDVIQADYVWQEIETTFLARHRNFKPILTLNIGGERFEIPKENVLKASTSVLGALIAMKDWEPEDGVYFFDRNPVVFQNVLELLSTGSVKVNSLKGATELACLLEDLLFFELPFVFDEATKVLRFPLENEVHHHEEIPSSIDTLLTDKEIEAIPSSLGSKQIPKTHPRHALLRQLNCLTYQGLKLDERISSSSGKLRKLDSWRNLEKKVRHCAEVAQSQIKLDFRGKQIIVSASTLSKSSWFESQMSGSQLNSQADAYTIDRDPRNVHVILDFLRSGKWNLDLVDKNNFDAFLEDVDFFQIADRPTLPK